MNADDNFIAHHGVKGMRWGVRRTPAQLGHRTSTTKKKKTSASPFSSIVKSRNESKKRKKALKAKKQKIVDAAKKQKAAEIEAKELAAYEAKMAKKYKLSTAPVKEKKPKKEKEPKPKKKTTVSSLSDAELQAVVNRIALEKRYAELTAPKPKTKSFLSSNMEKLAGTAIQTVGTKMINNAVNNMLGTNQNGNQKPQNNQSNQSNQSVKVSVPKPPAIPKPDPTAVKATNPVYNATASRLNMDPTIFYGKTDYVFGNYEPSDTVSSFLNYQRKKNKF